MHERGNQLQVVLLVSAFLARRLENVRVLQGYDPRSETAKCDREAWT
jgi:hypothetical protein